MKPKRVSNASRYKRMLARLPCASSSLLMIAGFSPRRIQGFAEAHFAAKTKKIGEGVDANACARSADFCAAMLPRLALRYRQIRPAAPFGPGAVIEHDALFSGRLQREQ